MGIKNIRTKVQARVKRAGRMNVIYRDAKGRTRDATVIAAGTASGLKIKLGAPLRSVVDNVPACTSTKGTSCYVNRIG